jgi:UPF0042 nucleotide-binding protein
MSDPASAFDAEQAGRRAPLLLITGLSGAGRGSALKGLEDMGYEAVDNLPLSLLHRLVTGGSGPIGPMAVGIDVRTRGFTVASLLSEIEGLRGPGLDLRLVFIDCDDDVLARRYTETRRRHPLAGDLPVIDGIRMERARLSALRSLADVVIDTSRFKLGDLRRVLSGYFALDAEPHLSLFVTSFSFREGLPREADLVFDVRFLDNPHYIPHLKPLTGLNAEVGAHVAADPAFQPFWDALTTLIRPLLPRYDQEGKHYLTIALGCTGGRHRSVYVAERLGAWLRADGQVVNVAHRDIDLVERRAQQGQETAVSSTNPPTTPC